MKKTEQAFSYFKNLFIPLLLMLGLLNVATLFKKTAIGIFYTQFSMEAFSYLGSAAFVASLIFQIILVLVLSRYSLRSWFGPLLLSIFFTLLIVQFFLLEMDGNVLSVGGAPLVEIAQKWKASLGLFILTFFSPTFFLVMGWAFANQVTKLSEGMKYYIPLGFLSGLFVLPFYAENSRPLFGSDFPLFFAAAAVFLTWVVFFLTSKNLPEERWELSNGEPQKGRQKLPIFKLACLMIGLALMKKFLDLDFKTQLRAALPTPEGQKLYLQNYTMILGFGTVALSAFFAFVGPILLKKWGWRFTASLAPLLTLVGLGALELGNQFNDLNLDLNVGLHILVATLITGLLFPLVQIAYLSIPQMSRFKAKGWTELVILPLFQPSGIATALLFVFGSIGATMPYIVSLSLFIVGLMILSIYLLGKRTGLSNKKEELTNQSE